MSTQSSIWETSKTFRFALCLTTKSGSEYKRASLSRNQLDRSSSHRADCSLLLTPRTDFGEENASEIRKWFTFFGLDKTR